MRILLILFIALALCSLSFATALDVGGDFGDSWLTKYSNKFTSDKGSSNTDDLWKWGGAPHGYEVINGKLYALLAPTEWYYPSIMSNSTPIVINGTSLLKNRNLMPIDFLFQEFMNNPLYIAQTAEQPVEVIYPREPIDGLL
ncbi:MAG: hypothetical protein ACE14P_14550 [Methanotrichaceae archaeon]